MKLLRLVNADIYRDGGSYEARFETDENLDYTLWLECSREPDHEGLHHQLLFEYRGVERPEDCPPVISGSVAENEILERVQEFLSSPEVSPAPWLDYDDRVVRLTEMLHYIFVREPYQI